MTDFVVFHMYLISAYRPAILAFQKYDQGLVFLTLFRCYLFDQHRNFLFVYILQEPKRSNSGVFVVIRCKVLYSLEIFISGKSGEII